ncbi:MAG TPA: DinB family protein [Fimbriimonadaceae bacterium]|nr:DinB family protein [Fimbriimonadaceae bacterium]HRJ97691.1 DinB family protein [Fimbriimonadaceae bacterium]
MDVTEALLDSWDRQCRIVEAVASLVDEANRHVKPSEDGWPLDKQLAHMHNTRKFWLSQVAPQHAANLGEVYADENGTLISDLDAIKACLRASGLAVREAVREGLAKVGGPMTGENATYDNPVLLLQHMVWHDGWHVGLIFLALRLNGQEPPEEWEESHVWGQWRTETW